ncbi:methyltransferase domain-containing protein [Leucobacter sp. GX24907]
MSSVHCDYFEAEACRSCTLIETPYARQLAEKQLRCRELLRTVPEQAWLSPVEGGVRDFRNKAKLVVGGETGALTLGILGPDRSGVDLRDCLIQSNGIREAIPVIADFLESTGLAPYDVRRRRGELKFVHVTEAPVKSAGAASLTSVPRSRARGDLMLRFVVRSREGLFRIRARLDRLRVSLPQAVVVSVNLLPEHKAVLEGEQEEILLGSSLEMDLGPVALHLLPQSFFQTNTAVAQALYAQAAEWVTRTAPASMWDLYCGVGGFALHCAAALQGHAVTQEHMKEPKRSGINSDVDIVGVEVSEAAVDSASRSAAEEGLPVRFIAQDATEFALGIDAADWPELVIVNPPRRGIGERLATWLESSDEIRSVVYSSCNPESLARDLAAMPSLRPVEARVFDMFPHTRHLEVAVLLERVAESEEPGGN